MGGKSCLGWKEAGKSGAAGSSDSQSVGNHSRCQAARGGIGFAMEGKQRPLASAGRRRGGPETEGGEAAQGGQAAPQDETAPRSREPWQAGAGEVPTTRT